MGRKLVTAAAMKEAYHRLLNIDEIPEPRQLIAVDLLLPHTNDDIKIEAYKYCGFVFMSENAYCQYLRSGILPPLGTVPDNYVPNIKFPYLPNL